MICDKCLEEVEPNNNALLYDAALSALIQNRPVLESVSETSGGLTGEVTRTAFYRQGYHPQTLFLLDFDVFRKGEIVPGKPEQSVRNVMRSHTRARHLYATTSCEGSPSRRQTIEEGKWGNGHSMGELAPFAKQAYEIVKALETPALASA